MFRLLGIHQTMRFLIAAFGSIDTRVIVTNLLWNIGEFSVLNFIIRGTSWCCTEDDASVLGCAHLDRESYLLLVVSFIHSLQVPERAYVNPFLRFLLLRYHYYVGFVRIEKLSLSKRWLPRTITVQWVMIYIGDRVEKRRTVEMSSARVLELKFA